MSEENKFKKKWGTLKKVARQGGPKLLFHLACAKLHIRLKSPYKKWIAKNEKDILQTTELEFQPLISVVVPVYNVSDAMLRDCIESVKAQTYQNWQLCMADDASTWESVRTILREYEKEERIKVVYRKENGHISQATNSAIEIADGEFLAFMDCDDTLAPNALYEVAKCLNDDPALDFIYSDEDKLDEEGKKRSYPHFKADWSPDTLMNLMYTSHLGVYRKSLVESVGGLREGFEGAQDYDLTLRITEKTEKIAHIPKVLYHWRVRSESTSADAMAKPYVMEAQKRAKEEALFRRGLKGEVEFVKEALQFRVNYHAEGDPMVSIVIPSKDNFDVFSRCVNSISDRTVYPNYEVVAVDNGSSPAAKEKYEALCEKLHIRYVYEPETFNFSRMCNRGAAHAKGEYVLFLNDDTEVLTKDWLNRMVGQASLAHAGAVGAKLYYPDSYLIQHCGVVNIKEGPSHLFCQADDRLVQDFGRNRMDYNYSAVTGACLMVSKGKYDAVGGYDEDLPIAYNDVDLCFKLLKAGYYNVMRNDVCLYHYESLSRGDDRADKAKFERLKRDRAKLYDRHKDMYQRDPYYSYHIREV